MKRPPRRGALRGAAAVFVREARLVGGDATLVAVLLAAPLFYAFFYNSVYLYKSEHDVPVVVVDRDRTAASRALLRSLDAHPRLCVAEAVDGLPAAQERVYRSEAGGVVVVPEGFSAGLRRGAGADLALYLDASRFLVASDVNTAVAEVTGTMAAGVRLRAYEGRGATSGQAAARAEPLRAVVKPLFAPNETYGGFMIPGLLALILQQTLFIGVGVAVAKEREEGRLGRLYRVSNGSLWAVLTGKGAFYAGLFGLYALFFLAVVLPALGGTAGGEAGTLALLTLLLLHAVVFTGFFAASFFRRKVSPLQFFVLTSYPVFVLSGYSWPLYAMPVPVRLLAQLLPGTPYLQAFRRVALMGATWRHVLPELLQLAALTAVAYALCYARLRHLARASTGVARHAGVLRPRAAEKSS